MTYDPNEPQLPELYWPAGQEAILENFSQGDSVLGIDHVAFSASDADNGKHDTMRLREQPDPPSTEHNEAALYCINSPTLGFTACIRDEDDGEIICVGGGSITGAYPQPVAAALFDSNGVTAGTPINIASISVVGSNPVTITITFTTPISAACTFQIGTRPGAFPSLLNPQVSVLNTTTCEIIYTPPLPTISRWDEMSLLIWEVQ